MGTPHPRTVYGVALTPQDPKYSPCMGEIIIESTQKDHLGAALDAVFSDSSPRYPLGLGLPYLLLTVGHALLSPPLQITHGHRRRDECRRTVGPTSNTPPIP